MDANKQRFWMLAERARFSPATEQDEHRIRFEDERRALRLQSVLADPPWRDADQIVDPSIILPYLTNVPASIDRFGTWAYFDGISVVAAGAGPEPHVLLDSAALLPYGNVTDVAIGYDDILYVAAGGNVVLLDLRRRFAPVLLSTPGFSAWRLAAHPAGGCVALSGPIAPGQLQPTPIPSPMSARFARVVGRPLPFVPPEAPPGVFEPSERNPNPPEISMQSLGLFKGIHPAAVAVSPGGRVAVVCWRQPAQDGTIAPAELRFVGENGLGDAIPLQGLSRPTSFTWLAEDTIAVIFRVSEGTMLGGKAVALAYSIGKDGEPAVPLGDYYPLPPKTTHFLHSVSSPPHYDPGAGEPPAPFHQVSFPSYATSGEMENAMGDGVPPIDAGQPGATWHRIYLEACLPVRTGVRVFLAATNTLERPSREDAGAWYEHLFGDVEPRSNAPDVPRGAWVPAASELPFHEGLLSGDIEPERRGLFTALVQRSNRRVRSLRGRYLWVRIELVGDGRATPEVAALRMYGPRFSYLNQYLPELYREEIFGEEADASPARATPADFLERFLGIVEGVLTPIEDRVASAFMLTDPRKAPDESLEWLASFIGLSFDPLVPEERRRRLLAAAPRIRPWRGTLRGLSLALDAVTDGAVSRGALVIVEDFRLRRTFSTILGANLDTEDDPLLPGLVESGNSYVGDTLFLGAEGQKEFLALFGEGIEQTAAEHEAVEAFFEKLAHRVTILVHEALPPADIALVRRLAELEAPAHVRVSVARASHPFMVGIASLVGVDSFLGAPVLPGSVRVGRSALGVRDVLARLPSLDPRLEGGDSQ
ncbi:phage tail protein [Polyangium sp. y55x31]|uniref:phage tail protein n=1 Tax=Polyangium sp. y55x31 TaxID=3042688 RepID=UPI0024826E07|nr:phage tail protein [Polyangium sp. y55x31]MDI1476557.1 phage tail protein [Polyangium sp. y55x31]